MTERHGASLFADVGASRGGFDVDVHLEVPAGGCLAIFGPNGAGKSTLLGALAGLLPLRRGEVRLDDRVLERAGQPLEGAGRPRGRAGQLRERPEHRRITLLEQKPRLFPHLTLAQNIAFGPRAQGVARSDARRTALDWLERIGLAHRADAHPHELSGGQQQRVAVARAFAADPRVILLDEPFSALDAESAPAVRRLLSEELTRTGTTSVLVTHELSDAFPWAESCLVLDHGRVVDSGSPHELATKPRHPFAARLAGFCVVPGVWREGSLQVAGAALGGVPDVPVAEGSAAFGIVAPRDVAVWRDAGAVRTSIRSVSARAGTLRLETEVGLIAELSLAEALASTDGRMPEPGDPVSVRPTALRVVPAE
ncbi:sulfate/molybdate ABC transporter ATP-binding protein [Humibacter sp.]|uniref:sulfate/molybdate ABC transporter ATP-binding protein n=1 Tax=Humibacter sp. TaxID=1940291 RepID=UPI003F7D490C